MTKKWVCAAIILAAIFLCLSPQATQAARGTPGTSEFGYGANLYPDGPNYAEALNLANDLSLDWVNIQIPWQTYYPSMDASADWSNLDQAMAYASTNGISVLFSITQAPAWALGKNGPDANLTLQFMLELNKRYPSKINAFELFPGANTRSGWGRTPDAKSYLKLFQSIKDQLKTVDGNILLVGGGLVPASADQNFDGQDDLDFLQGLYNAGANKVINIISIDLSDVTGDALTPPDGSEHRILRHYEEVRQVMLKNNAANSLIWVTHLRFPNGTINHSDLIYNDVNNQTSWLSQAFSQLRSQLYIGVAFLDSLNPESQGSSKGSWSLVGDGKNYQPFYSTFRDLISRNSPENILLKRGRPKSNVLVKRRT
ncbi:MAG: hypothetical protein P4L50_01360 [Anaerolineaceae bacterium]|nr:hypothetical protein [Anaerolineaceae bacterium]